MATTTLTPGDRVFATYAYDGSGVALRGLVHLVAFDDSNALIDFGACPNTDAVATLARHPGYFPEEKLVRLPLSAITTQDEPAPLASFNFLD